MSNTEARIGHGITLSYGDGATPTEAFTALAELIDIQLPERSRDSIEATTYASPNRMKEYIVGLGEPGELTFVVHFVPGSVTQLWLEGESQDPVIRNWRAVLPVAGPVGSEYTQQRITWAASLKGYKPGTPIDEAMTLEITLQVTGDWTQEDVA